MARIPESFIDTLLSRTDIVSIIEEVFPLQRSGHEYKACCPFHNEKTPSFYVSPQKQFYHCFGCGAHGTAIGFIMEYERLDFREAIQMLAEKAGLSVPNNSESPQNRRREESLHAVLDEAANWYAKQLKKNKGALQYLAQRGVHSSIIERYGLGFAPDGWQNLLSYLKPRFPSKLIEASGLVSIKNEHPYDRFRSRLMFPIRDIRGRTIAFGGRVLNDTLPKYLNSSDTPIFHKGQELYGLYEARQFSSRTVDSLIVVEGYMDVISLSQAGLPNAVATLGTATTANHVQRLQRFASTICFCFDGDLAGRKAAWKALLQSLSIVHDGLQILFLFLPDNEDPDSLVRQAGKEAFEEQIKQALPLSAYLLNELNRRHSPRTMEGRAALFNEAVPLLRELSGTGLRDQLTTEIAKICRISEDRIRKALTNQDDLPHSAPQKRSKPAITRTPVRLAIALILTYPRIARTVLQEHSISPDPPLVPGTNLLSAMIEILAHNPHITTAGLLERWRNQSSYEQLCTLAQSVNGNLDDKIVEAELRDALHRIQAQQIEIGVEKLLELSRQRPLTHDEKMELKTLLGERTKS